MADEVEEIYEEEAPLTAEELFEQHKAEIDAAFEEKGFFRRLGDMCKGLSKSHSSAEYKLARTELQRLAAPILAIFLPVIGIVSLIVVTAVSGEQDESIVVEIAKVEQEPEQEPEPEPEPPPDETPPDETVDVQVDTPTVNVQTEMVDHSPPSNEPVSVKPAEADTVAIIKSPVTMKSMAGSRNPGVRGKYTSGGAGYGDKNTEAAVMKALRWLKHTQQPDGSWKPQPTANTALAVLAFLAHGETPASAEFGYTVEKAMQYLVDALQVDGKGVPRFKNSDGNEYAFLIATYALGETYGMTKNINTKEAALKAMQRIIDNQSPTGGWDYKLNKESTRDDLSFAGWALQALKACKMAGLHPEGLDACIKKAINCLKKRNFHTDHFTYCAGNNNHPGLTATGCLCMQLLGYAQEKEVATSLEYMRGWNPSFDSAGMNVGKDCPNPQYYCYYASQCKYQAGMKAGANAADTKTWQTWNAAMKALYPRTIKTLPQKIADANGKMQEMGFWDCGQDGTCKSAGHTMTTCLCALQLMVYYRYLPTTNLKAGAAEDHDDSSKGATSKKDEVNVEVDI